MPLTISSRFVLNNGAEIPYFGFGTYQIKSSAAEEAVSEALAVGYRHIDTAAIYGNEKEVGLALKKSGLLREEVFIATKLWNEDQEEKRVSEAFNRSLDALGIDYIDLYLIHWPVTGKRIQSWKAMEKIAESGRSKAIGVSNFAIRHLEELLAECSIIPAVNQVEFNPFLYQKDLLDYCKSRNIAIEAYTPLSRGRKLDHPVLRDLSGRYHKTPAQILIRWALEHELIVIPKSSQKKRIIENADIFDFSINQEDMKKLNSLNEGFRVAWDPSRIP